MSIYLQFGIIMFHAANGQFLHIASRQKVYAHMSNIRDHLPVEDQVDRIDRMMIFIAIGLAIRFALTLFAFFGSIKPHSSYGLRSIVWLFFWAWAPVNMFFIPLVWLCVSILFIEASTIAFAIIQVLKTQTLRQETLDAIASWEKRNQGFNSEITIAESDTSLKSPAFSTFSGTTFKSVPRNTSGKQSIDSQKNDMFTMATLENALKLTQIHPFMRMVSPNSSPKHRHKQFVVAVRIYDYFVNLEFSEFPINISSEEMKHLYSIFETLATMPCRNGGFRANLKSVTRITELRKKDALECVAIPKEFTQDVFDTAESGIKYLALTNTWPKFVNARCANPQVEKEDCDSWTTRMLCGLSV
ncbi:hypothetical protein K469DRAFT_728678 [Zopfia rhizophila CBS 207.26]|uniref:RGS domain-containing protein n=1 Tax=Zopfia rhizophila CBS 207.26 TaxID=1314779 RepID=A0A6A6EPB9_9PEZI|nr:hypothetical protein K469DRAFT_728678 [Zopfia rhizophila CBS 207.26]